MLNHYLKISNLEKCFTMALLFILGCGGDDSPNSSPGNNVPTVSIKTMSCPSTGINEICRDVGRLIVEYDANDIDGQSVVVTGRLVSNALNMSVPLIAVGENLEQELASFSGVQDVIVELTATDPNQAFTTTTAVIGEIDINNSPTCTAVALVQNFDVDPTGNGVALIDISQCSDPESDPMTLGNDILDLSTVRSYNQTVTVSDSFASQTSYAISGDIIQPNLTRQEFTDQLIADPNIIGADSCFTPLVVVFDEAIVCDFQGEWQGFQYDSNVDTSSFSNIALVDSAQGFENLAANTSLASIVANFVKVGLPDNQAVANPGNTDIVLAATADRDPNGGYGNFVLSGNGYRLEGMATENSSINCENNAYLLPISTASGSRASLHTIDLAFVAAVGQTIRISNCIATNAAGIQTVLEGDIDIAITDTINQNPVVNSVIGLDSGEEGTRTIIANVVDPDSNLTSVTLRYRMSGTGTAWTEETFTPVVATDNFSLVSNFQFSSNLDEAGIIEYQVVAQDQFGGQGISTLANSNFDANEATAQATIEAEINLDPNKLVSCFDCIYIDQNGSSLGPFDAIFTDPSGAEFIYEYNGEGRNATDLQILEDSLIGTTVIYYNVPISSVSNIRTNVQNN